MSDFGALLRVRTRKPHRCEWCGEPILVGSLVGNYRGKWQGDWQNWYMHDECEEARSQEDKYGDGFSPYENERPKVYTANEVRAGLHITEADNVPCDAAAEMGHL